MSSKKKLMLVGDIAHSLESEGVAILTPNAVRARLKSAMLHLATESCKALGAEVNDAELERVATSRAFQEAVAVLLHEGDDP
jgi:hypothetical protein